MKHINQIVLSLFPVGLVGALLNYIGMIHISWWWFLPIALMGLQFIWTLCFIGFGMLFVKKITKP